MFVVLTLMFSKVDEAYKYVWLSCKNVSLCKNDKILRKEERQSKEEEE